MPRVLPSLSGFCDTEVYPCVSHITPDTTDPIGSSCYFIKINYLGGKVKINKCGHQLVLSSKMYLVLLLFNYSGIKINIKNCIHQLKFNWCGYIENINSVVNY